MHGIQEHLIIASDLISPFFMAISSAEAPDPCARARLKGLTTSAPELDFVALLWTPWDSLATCQLGSVDG